MTHLAIYETKRTLRRERAAWQRAALGLLVLSVAVNGVLYGLYLRQERQAERWESEYHRAETDKQAALTVCGELSAKLETEAQASAEQVAAYEALDGYRYIGKCLVTAYCCEPYKHACGTGDGLTATGIPVQPGIVAVDPEVIPLGSTVLIDGVSYLAADVGGALKGLHVDVAVETHREAVDFGMRYAEVWTVTEVSP